MDKNSIGAFWGGKIALFCVSFQVRMIGLCDLFYNGGAELGAGVLEVLRGVHVID